MPPRKQVLDGLGAFKGRSVALHALTAAGGLLCGSTAVPIRVLHDERLRCPQARLQLLAFQCGRPSIERQRPAS